MNTNQFVIKSLELHLFFARILKEHAFFLRAGFTPADPAFTERAAFFQRGFEALLRDAVMLTGGHRQPGGDRFGRDCDGVHSLGRKADGVLHRNSH